MGADSVRGRPSELWGNWRGQKGRPQGLGSRTVMEGEAAALFSFFGHGVLHGMWDLSSPSRD